MDESAKDPASIIKKIAQKVNTEYAKSTKSEDPRDKKIAFVAEDVMGKDIEYIPCNVPQINDAIGGFPRGYIVGITGDSNAGKTSLALSVAKNIQDRGEWVLYLNTEGDFSHQARKVGIDLSRTIVLEPRDYGEQLIDAVEEFLYDKEKRCATGLIGCVIVDSVNTLVTRAEIVKAEEEGAAANAQLGSEARMVTNFLKRITGRGLLRKGTIIFLIIQERANLTPYGGPTRIPGAKAVRYLSKIFLRLGESPLSDKEKVWGHKVTFRVLKNHVNGRHPRGEYVVNYETGIDDSKDLIQKALDSGHLQKVKRSYILCLPEPLLFPGMAKLEEAVLTDLGLRESLRTLLGRAPQSLESLPEPSPYVSASPEED